MTIPLKRCLNHPLARIVILGLVIRILYATLDTQIHHPDEIFQSLEQSFRLVAGYGIIPWDYIYGLRSYALPLLFTPVLYLLKILNLLKPWVYVPLVKYALSTASTVVILAGYTLTRDLTGKSKYGLLSALLLALNPVLIYFSPRALSESVALTFLSLAVVINSTIKSSSGKFFTAFFLATGVLFRLQWFPVLVLGIYSLHKTPVSLTPYVKGLVASLISFGVIDLYFYHAPFIHIFNNLKTSFFSGLSAEFGVQPWWYYLLALLTLSLPTVLCIFSSSGNVKRSPLLITTFSILLIHTVIPHKEFRFILILFPLITVLAAFPLYRIAAGFSSKPLRLLLVFSVFWLILVWQNRLPFEPWFLGTPYAAVDQGLIASWHHPLTCGLYFTDRDWVYTGGYYYLGQPVSLLDLTAQEPSTSADLIIYPHTQTNLASGSQLIKTTPAYSVVYQGNVLNGFRYDIVHNSNCEASTPAYTRSFDYLTPYLKQFKTYPLK